MKLDAYKTELSQVGLIDNQQTVYGCLLGYTSLPASKVASLTGIKRQLVYKVLDELIELGLVQKEDLPGSVAQFSAEHPLALRELVNQKQTAVKKSADALQSIMSELVSEYTARSGKPGVRIMTGISGVAELYEDILNENQDLCLIRSSKDVHRPELETLVAEQIENQVKQQINTRAITPFTNETQQELDEWDPSHLVSRRLSDLTQLDLPAQVIIYADKVAITAYETELITTIIENQAINTSFRIMFNFMWNSLEAEDQRIRTGIKNGSLVPPLPNSDAQNTL